MITLTNTQNLRLSSITVERIKTFLECSKQYKKLKIIWENDDNTFDKSIEETVVLIINNLHQLHCKHIVIDVLLWEMENCLEYDGDEYWCDKCGWNTFVEDVTDSYFNRAGETTSIKMFELL